MKTYRICNPQPAPRDQALREDERGPGLYEGEVLVELGDIHAALSVDLEWLENGAGVTMKGTARWCDADGQTHLCPADKHVESFLPLTVDPVTFSRHGIDPLKKEVLLALMGEEPELMEEDDIPAIRLSPTVKLNASIRHAAGSVSSMRTSADPTTLLA